MKTKVLKILKECDEHISGEVISNKLGVTRTTIWKAIASLRKDGYKIDSVTNKGYKLIKVPDILSKDEIQTYLNTQKIGKNIYAYKEVDSTNKVAKALAQQGEKEGTLVISESQTRGRGRLGRSWESPYGTGIWMSLILRPTIAPKYVSGITLVAGLAICEAIEDITNLDVYIKWPNDIVINGKKVCGILTQMSGEIERVNYVILGIGINVNMDNFPEPLKNTGTSLKIETGREYKRVKIVAKSLEIFEKYYEEYLEFGISDSMLDKYKKSCITLTNKVSIINKDETFIADPIDIDKEGALIVKKENGEYETITSGEVSVRGIYGYV